MRRRLKRIQDSDEEKEVREDDVKEKGKEKVAKKKQKEKRRTAVARKNPSAFGRPPRKSTGPRVEIDVETFQAAPPEIILLDEKDDEVEFLDNNGRSATPISNAKATIPKKLSSLRMDSPTQNQDNAERQKNMSNEQKEKESSQTALRERKDEKGKEKEEQKETNAIQEENWRCPRCTLYNSIALKKCEVCGEDKPSVLSSLVLDFTIPITNAPMPTENWACAACTLLNSPSRASCHLCGEPMPRNNDKAFEAAKATVNNSDTVKEEKAKEEETTKKETENRQEGEKCTEEKEEEVESFFDNDSILDVRQDGTGNKKEASEEEEKKGGEEARSDEKEHKGDESEGCTVQDSEEPQHPSSYDSMIEGVLAMPSCHEELLTRLAGLYRGHRATFLSLARSVKKRIHSGSEVVPSAKRRRVQQQQDKDQDLEEEEGKEKEQESENVNENEKKEEGDEEVEESTSGEEGEEECLDESENENEFDDEIIDLDDNFDDEDQDDLFKSLQWLEEFCKNKSYGITWYPDAVHKLHDAIEDYIENLFAHANLIAQSEGGRGHVTARDLRTAHRRSPLTKDEVKCHLAVSSNPNEPVLDLDAVPIKIQK